MENDGTTQNKTCKEKVLDAFNGRMADIKAIWDYESSHDGDPHPEMGSLNEYGLCFDFVEAGTTRDQRSPYYRYQLSWGGPSEEFRIYLNGEIDFWYLDWGDGASIPVEGEDKTILWDIFQCQVTPEHWEFIKEYV